MEIAQNTDLDTLLTYGNYYIRTNNNAATMTNIPAAKACTIKVFDPSGVGGYTAQLMITYQSDIYIRTYNVTSGNWNPNWMQISTSSVNMASVNMTAVPMGQEVEMD